MDRDGLQIIKITYDNGTYIGEYHSKNGTPIENGTGLFIWSNGDRYEGEYIMGSRTGHGSFVWADGRRYDGEFKNDIRSGNGRIAWVDGTVYEGDFEDGKMNGKGMLSWPNGDTYVGWFFNDHMEGHGIHYSVEGSVIYEGQWIESCPVNKFE
jgi:hypothetical protein